MAGLPLRLAGRTDVVPQDNGFTVPALDDSGMTTASGLEQTIPSSYDLLYAKSHAYQEKAGAGHWGAEEESRTFRLSYNIPASNLLGFWA
ncbi:hypothetical protein H9L39_17769 [Fusarium oxysporum f. sp. albedinis]|nr:hypothetical protein H9L39_17769 [Fusarium oxysporum f. sp. albedinis]